TWLEEDGQAEVNRLERRILLLVRKQKVLRLQIPMNHPLLVAELHHLNNRSHHPSRRPLCVVSPGNDPIKQLPTLTQLHHQMHGVLASLKLTMLELVGKCFIIATSRRTSSTSTAVRSFRLDMDLQASRSLVSRSMQR
ncbi:phenylalanine--tRNA ligase alpha subunit, partial [Striga asiatica]